MNPTIDVAIPVLPCRSMSVITDFYLRLGFEGGAHELNQDYAIFTRDTIELHFFLHADLVPEASWAGCYIRVLDLQSLYEASLASGLPYSGIPRMNRLEDKPWGLKEFAVVDPDGNLIRIGQII
jgi:catechol 2,3-dioxygenase-like lactoylglutathione lyase family enzyme